MFLAVGAAAKPPLRGGVEANQEFKWLTTLGCFVALRASRNDAGVVG